MKQSRKKVLWIIFLLACGAAVLLFACFYRTPRLLDIATRITHVKHFVCWISRQEVIIEPQDNTGAVYNVDTRILTSFKATNLQWQKSIDDRASKLSADFSYDDHIIKMKKQWNVSTLQRHHSVLIYVPSSRYLFESALSPDGRHRAWMVVTPRVSLFQIILHYLHINARFDNTITMNLYVSQPNANEAKLVGSERVTKSFNEAPSFLWSRIALDWFPDGKKVSFVYKNALWTIPVR